MKVTTNKKKILAIGKYIRISPYKARRVLDQIRGKHYKEALLILEFLPYRCTKLIQNILKSAVANAVNNYSLEKNNLVIEEIFANQGPTFKRLQPRAQGKAFPIRKPTCHISISLTTKL
uniref:Large ribosomal subunit protein uL22c n=1 Tax=Hildenbrandia rivularis TaxID=135206 RepID=A0A1C9CFT8_9FLOR|nr:ribosomal protein L22 [Hildenbrandia rivularis]AOM67239.1 ribosomal protein L22 [Hildenbrandia rivularis]